MRPELYIARRLNPAEADGHKAPLGVRIGVAGVALAYTVMLLSIAIVTGFKQEITHKVTGYESQIVLQGRDQNLSDGVSSGEIPYLVRNASTDSLIKAILGPDVSIKSVIDLPVLLKTDSAFSALILRTVDSTNDYSLITQNIVEGSWPPDSDGTKDDVAISQATASDLGLKKGDKVFAHFFRNDNIVTRRLNIKAVYDTHFDDYDRHFAFADRAIARSVTKQPDSIVTSVAIDRLSESMDLGQATENLQSALVFSTIRRGAPTDAIPVVSNVRQNGAIYLNWLELLDTNVVVIISLMSVVAGFTLVSSLFILILERVGMIGLLKAIGATDKQIRGIFIWLAEKIVGKGLMIGNTIGLFLYFIQRWFKILPLNPDAYYLSYVPVSLDVTSFIVLNLGIIIGAFVILVFPSHIITKMSPVNALRHDNQGED